VQTLIFAADISASRIPAKITVDFGDVLVRLPRPFMKNDTMTTALNFVLAVLAILGVIFTLMAILRTSEMRRLAAGAAVANTELMRAQGLANDANAYNQTAKNPELTRILQTIQPKPATK
jgi:uncharacterized protein HemY